MDRGYLKLWRRSIDSEIFHNPEMWRLWTWCLMKTSYKTRFVPFKTGKGKLSVQLNPGQFIFGRNKAAEFLGDSPSTLWKRMKKLELIGNISIESNRQYSIVNICNWDEYQEQDSDEVTSKEQAGDKQVTTEEQLSDTNKKLKKLKKETLVDEKKRQPDCPHQKIVILYNNILSSKLQAVKLNLWNGTRKTHLAARWREDIERQNIEWWEKYFNSVFESSFLTGNSGKNSGKNWKANLGWLVKPGNMVKVLEGNYNGQSPAESCQSCQYQQRGDCKKDKLCTSFTIGTK